MRVIRDNRYSVMAMLEAFVYDPLISWRLLAKHNVQAAPPDQVPFLLHPYPRSLSYKLIAARWNADDQSREQR